MLCGQYRQWTTSPLTDGLSKPHWEQQNTALISWRTNHVPSQTACTCMTWVSCFDLHEADLYIINLKWYYAAAKVINFLCLYSKCLLLLCCLELHLYTTCISILEAEKQKMCCSVRCEMYVYLKCRQMICFSVLLNIPHFICLLSDMKFKQKFSIVWFLVKKTSQKCHTTCPESLVSKMCHHQMV
jgi:hypothetical protein